MLSDAGADPAESSCLVVEFMAELPTAVVEKDDLGISRVNLDQLTAFGNVMEHVCKTIEAIE